MYNVTVYFIVYFTPGTEGAFYTVSWCALFLSLFLQAEIFIVAKSVSAHPIFHECMSCVCSEDINNIVSHQFGTLGLLETQNTLQQLYEAILCFFFPNVFFFFLNSKQGPTYLCCLRDCYEAILPCSAKYFFVDYRTLPSDSHLFSPTLILPIFYFLSVTCLVSARFKLYKLLMIATALSTLPNDRTNERTAAMIAYVTVAAVVLALCIMYSCLCCNGLQHHLCVFSSGACLASSHPSPLFVSHFSDIPFFRPSFPGKVMHLMKGECCPRIMMTITSCTPHLLHCLLPWLPCTYSTLPFSYPPLLLHSFSLSFLFSPPHP